MKIKINKMTQTTPTLRDVPEGDLFVLLENNDVYVKTAIVTFGFYGCVSIRNGKITDMASCTKVRPVHKVDILVDDFPRNIK